MVYSTETPGDVKLLPLPEEEFQKGKVQELGVLDDFRVRILPVLGPLRAKQWYESRSMPQSVDECQVKVVEDDAYSCDKDDMAVSDFAGV